MNVLRKFFKYYLALLFLTFIFYICNFYNYTPEAHNSNNINVEELFNSGYQSIDYIFTSKEVNNANITDTTISIRSENFDDDFFDNVVNLKSINGYTVNYYDGALVIEGLIPDFLYDSLLIEAELNNGYNYIFQIKNFKTYKAQNTIDQFIIKTLQYTLKRSILPMDFYLWQHKILNKEITPVEFIVRILQDPRLIRDFTSVEKIIDKMYSSIFLNRISQEELSFYISKFNEFKYNYYMSNYEVFKLIFEDMIKCEEFENRIKNLNLHEINGPVTTRYSEVYSSFNKDYTLNYDNNGMLYVMDYNELNKSEVNETTAKIFLNDGFKNKLNSWNVKEISIPNASVKFQDGKIVIEGLEPNTVYKNFIIKYINQGLEKKIFVERIKTTTVNNDTFSISNEIDLKYNFVDDFNISTDEFIKEFYKEFYKIDMYDMNNYCFKILFVSGVNGFVKLMNLVEKFDFGIKEEILVSEIYNTLFNRMPNEFTLNYWVKNFQQLKKDYGYCNSVKSITSEMIESDEFKIILNNCILRNLIILNNRPKRLHNM